MKGINATWAGISSSLDAPFTPNLPSKVSDHVKLEICDDGKPFDPLSLPEPDLSVPVEERPLGSLGVYLTRKLSRSIEYRRDETGNVLTVIKGLD